MKILFINPSFSRYGGIKGHGGSMIPLNLCYLAAYARQKHPDMTFKIIDSEIRGMSHEETVGETVAFSPDLIAISSNTCVFDSVIALTSQLKLRLPEVPIIIGGPHPSALPERTLVESRADFVCIGEGELTFVDLLSQLKNSDKNWCQINGLAFRDEYGNVHVNSRRELINDLDMLPFPARDLVDNHLYMPPPTKRVGLGPNTLLSTSRGCPHRCGFCGAHTVWTRKVRIRKAKFVVAEIKECIEKYGIRSFNLTDEFFTANKKRVLEVCRLICAHELDISWVCSARAERLDMETLEAMKEAGCNEISFGIESGNPEILSRIDKGLNLDEALRVVRLTKRVGITTHASYIIGYIGETEETIKDTIRFAKKLNTEVAAFFIASPLPGTSLYKEAQQNDYLRPDATWLDYSPLSNSESVLILPNLPIKTIRKWHRRSLRNYYFRFGYIFSRIASIRHWYEIVNLFDGLKIFLQIKR